MDGVIVQKLPVSFKGDNHVQFHLFLYSSEYDKRTTLKVIVR